MPEEKVPQVSPEDQRESAVENHCCEAVSKMKETMNHVIEGVSAKAGEVSAKVREGTSRAGNYTKAGLEKTEANIKEHPLGSLLTVLGVGIAVGVLLGLTCKHR